MPVPQISYETYCQEGGEVCPYCLGESLACSHQLEDDNFYLEVSCNDCEEEWAEGFTRDRVLLVSDESRDYL